MKVVRVDNFCRDTVDDKLVSTVGLSVLAANAIAEDLNKNVSDTSPYYYRVVSDDYKLNIFEP